MTGCALAGGDEDATGASHLQDGVEVVGLFGAVEEEEGALVGEGDLGGGLGVGARVVAVGAGDGFEGKGGLGTVVEGVEEDAIREAVGGECPQGLGSEGGFADAAWTAQGDDVAGLEVGQELGEFALAVGKVLGAGWALEGGGWRSVSMIVAGDGDDVAPSVGALNYGGWPRSYAGGRAFGPRPGLDVVAVMSP